MTGGLVESLRAGVMSDQRPRPDGRARSCLFVCTGNTCRSPMAEALCKALLARRSSVARSDDLGRLEGFLVVSAGVSATNGMAGRRPRHRGRPLARAVRSTSTRAVRRRPDLVRNADHILAMTADHLDMSSWNSVPEVADERPTARLRRRRHRRPRRLRPRDLPAGPPARSKATSNDFWKSWVTDPHGKGLPAGFANSQVVAIRRRCRM